MSSDPIPTIAAKHGPTTVVPESGGTILYVPDAPGSPAGTFGRLPKCGMALELKTVTASTDDEENAELRDMR